MAPTPSVIVNKLRALAGAVALRAAGWAQLVDPDRVVRSIPERWLDPAVRGHVVGMELVRPAGVESYSFADRFPPAFRREMHFARRHVYRLRDVSVNVATGACLAGSHYFQESYGSLRRCLSENPFPPSAGAPFHGSRAVTCVHPASYYHFLLEEVPRLLWALDRHEDLSVLLHASAPAYVVAVVGSICRNRGVELRMVEEQAIRVPGYVFTQAEAYSGFVHSSDVELLRSEFLPRANGASAGRKLYISRQGVSRSFDNEAEIASLVARAGFEVVAPERLDFEAQIRLFHDAAVIVAPHGAGLANLAWCRPGTRVLEIFSARHFNDCYARLSSTLGLSYTPVWAGETEGWGEVPREQLASFLEGSDLAGPFPDAQGASAGSPCR